MIIFVLSSTLIFHFCVCISQFLFQLSRCNNITIILLDHAWNVTNFVCNASHSGHTSRITCLGFWILQNEIPTHKVATRL